MNVNALHTYYKFSSSSQERRPMTQKKVREVSDKVCAVWAVEAKGFRSFRYDRVTKVEVIAKEDYKVRLGEFWKQVDLATE